MPTKTTLSGIVLAFVAIAGLQAAPVACTNTTLAALIALGSYNTTTNTGGCISQDKIFSNFAYSGSAQDPSSAVNATLVFQPGPANQDIHGWLFTDANGITNSWVSGFTLSYTIMVAPGNPLNVNITASKDQMNAGMDNPTNLVKVVDTQSAGTLSLDALATGDETRQITYAGRQSVNTSSVATVPTGGQILSYEQDFFETTVNLPEPASLLFMGIGLVVIGGIGRAKTLKN